MDQVQKDNLVRDRNLAEGLTLCPICHGTGNQSILTYKWCGECCGLGHVANRGKSKPGLLRGLIDKIGVLWWLLTGGHK